MSNTYWKSTVVTIRRDNSNIKFDKDAVTELDLLMSLFPMVSEKRFNEEYSVRCMVMIFARTFKKSLEGRKMLYDKIKGNKEFAKLIDSYESCFDEGITVKTLAWFVREDSPEKYEAWKSSWVKFAISRCFRSSVKESDIAEVLYRECWLDFIYSNTAMGEWFKFEDNKWTKDNNAIYIGGALRKKVSIRFTEANNKLSAAAANSDLSDASRKEIEGNMKVCLNILSKIRETTVCRNVIKESSIYFSIARFGDIQDNNHEILGLNNGVLECTLSSIKFRLGRPEDYVSMSSRVDYSSNFSWDHEYVKILMEWFRKLFITDSYVNFMVYFMACILRGKNPKKYLAMICGGGNNSKSILIKLLEITLGLYSVKVPVKMLYYTGPQQGSSGPNPELARTRGTRVSWYEEPDHTKKLSSGSVKTVAGGDSYFARNCNSDGGEIKALSKPIVICNTPPHVEEPDKAVHLRILIMKIESEFVKDPPKTVEEQYRLRKFPMDPYFEDKLPSLASAFLWILVETYRDNIGKVVPVPIEVENYTKQYWLKSNKYIMFTGMCVENVDNEESTIDTSFLYSAFKLWHTKYFPGIVIPEFPKFLDEIEKLWGHPNGDVWKKVSIKQGALRD
jgi:phage/plasmid-associated DNA primase